MKIDIMFGLKILEIFDKICLFEDRKARKVVKIVQIVMVPSFIVGTGRGNNFQHVLGEGGICPPIRRRALNGFLAEAVKRIKTRTDDEGGGSSLPKIRLCIKVPPTNSRQHSGT